VDSSLDGGKHLVALQPKSSRDSEEQNAPKRRWNRGAVEVPGAAKFAAASKAVSESRSDRCQRLLGLVEPRVEQDVIDYLASLVEDDDSEDAKDAVLEILEGHDVERSVAETFWLGLIHG